MQHLLSSKYPLSAPTPTPLPPHYPSPPVTPTPNPTPTPHPTPHTHTPPPHVLLVQFISTHNVWLQQIGTDLTQTGSTTPSIISGTVLFVGYNIVNTII